MASTLEDVKVAALAVAITRFVSEDQPGFVECSFRDAFGRTHTFVEKVPIVSAEHLWSDWEYPRKGEMDCTVLERFTGDRGESLVRVDTELPWHVESVEGQTQFVVPVSLLAATSPSDDT